MEDAKQNTQIMERPKILTISTDEETLGLVDEYVGNADYKFIKSDFDTKNIKKIIKNQSPSLILLDIDNSDIDIHRFSQYFENYNIPFIFIVGVMFDDDILEDILECSPYQFLIKEIEEDELLRAIAVVLKKHKLNTINVIEAKDKIREKNVELVVEKSNSVLLLFLCVSLILMALLTRNATWLQWVLLIPTLAMIINAIASIKKQKEVEMIEDGDKLPFVSIFIPAHNEQYTIKSTVESIAAMEYHYEGKPQYEIIVVNDGSSDSTGEILHDLKKDISNLKIVTRHPPRSGKGKGFVLNDALTLSKGEVIGVFDADTQVKTDYLKIIMSYLRDDTDGVQSRVKMFNKDENYLTRMQHLEFASFGNTLIAKDNLGMTGFLGGNGQFVKKQSIIDCGKWDGFAVTEDLNLAVKILLAGGKIRYCGECAVYQEAVAKWKPLFRQRVRWAIGNFETLFVYLPVILKAKIPIVEKMGIIEHISFYSFNLLIFFGFIITIVNAVSWFVFNNVTIIRMDAPLLVGLLSIVAFFPGTMIALSRDDPGIIEYILDIIRYYIYCYHLIPLFFMTMANMIFRKERKWSKTEHTGVGIEEPVEENAS